MLYVCLTFDWEGEHFFNYSEFRHVLHAIGADVPVTHFICPAYFTSGVKDAESILSDAISTKDEVGLHLHCYRSLIEKSGVEFRVEPNYYNKHLAAIKFRDWLVSFFPETIKSTFLRGVTSGRGVPLSAYSLSEIQKIIRYSKALLDEKLKCRVSSFRAGGWIANDNVFRALEETGFKIDSSAVPPNVVGSQENGMDLGSITDDYGEQYPVFSDYVKKIWGNKCIENGFLSNSIRMQSFEKTIDPNNSFFRVNRVAEYVNNFGMSDFVTFKRTIKPWLDGIMPEEKDYILNYGCHQEGDGFYKRPVIELVHYLKQLGTDQVSFHTLSSLHNALNSVEYVGDDQ